MNAVTRHLGMSGPLVGVFALAVLWGNRWRVDAISLAGIAVAAVAALLTPVLVSSMNRRVLRSGWEPALLPGERIVHESSADVYTSAQRGWLFLTDRRLLHHPLRAGAGDWSLPLGELAAARVGREAGIVATLLDVAARDGSTYTFKIEGPGEWVRHIEAARNRGPSLPQPAESHP